MRGPTGEIRVIQIHPTLRCNLRCGHCYSSSSPENNAKLSSATCAEVIEDAATLGYNVVGISGGEPLLYRSLPDVLKQARLLGLLTTITTNGQLLTHDVLERLADVVSLIAISIDGVPDSHNRLRCSSTAFSRMSSRLTGVRRSKIPFGFIFTLTQHNLHELEWVAKFALSQGASLLQVHPLEEVGRAASELPGSVPDQSELTWAFAEVARIRDMCASDMTIQFDVLRRGLLSSRPEVGFAESATVPSSSEPLANLLSPVVIEADGTVAPLKYGFPRRFSLGNVTESRLTELAQTWISGGGYEKFNTVCRKTQVALLAPRDAPRLLNWYQEVHSRADDDNVEIC